MEKYILMLTLFAMGCQCREYIYQKPLAPFYNEDGKPHYISTSEHMIIPGIYGRNYEVAMSPARNIFEMHLGQHQHYVQQKQGSAQQNIYAAAAGAGAGGYAQSQVQQANGNVAGYSQYLGSANALQNAAAYAQTLSQQLTQAGVQSQTNNQQFTGATGQYGVSNNQQNSGSLGAVNGQQNSGAYAQTSTQQAVNTGGYAQQNTGGSYAPNSRNTGAYGPANGQQSASSSAQSYRGSANLSQQIQRSQGNGGPVTRIIRRCYPNGRCEYIVDDRQHQQVLQQARANIVPVSNKCSSRPPPPPSQGGQSQRQNSSQGNASKKGIRDRRLFPYSEVPISNYPNKK